VSWVPGSVLAGVPGVPMGGGLTRWAARLSVRRRRRETGRGWEYHVPSLPADVRAHIGATESTQSDADGAAPQPPAQPVETTRSVSEPAPRRSKAVAAPRTRVATESADLWAWAEHQSADRRALGAERADLVRDVVALMAAGSTRDAALVAVAEQHGCTKASLKRWYLDAMRHDRADWAAALIPQARGVKAGANRAEIHPGAWDWFLAGWLSRKQPTVAEVYRRLCEIADAHGWAPLPHVATFERRVAEIPAHTVAYHRQGAEALALLIPRQRRDNTVYAPGEAVNGDGLKLDRLWVRWPDGEIISTTTLWPWQDLRSGKILAYRIAKTESTDLFRLATYDLTAICLPRAAWIDNTRVAANLAMTGQAAGRHRFAGPRRAEDPLGILKQLGIEPKFTDPNKEFASPGSKRIERAFGIGGLHTEIANNPRLRDRGYSKATAIDYAELAEIAAEEVARFNSRPGRRAPECAGVRSYDQLWADLTADPAYTPRVCPEAKRRLLLLMVEPCRADSRTGEIKLKAGTSHLGAARYWADWMPAIAGQRVAAYYDPADLQRPVTVYSLDGLRLGDAARLADAGHNDTTAAAEVRRVRIRQQKAWKKMAQDDQRLDAIRAAELYDSARTGAAAEIPEPGQVQPRRVVAAHFGCGSRRVLADGTLVDTATGEILDAEPAADADAAEQRFRASVADLAARRQRAADV
jgi:putative transposase